jgi:NOL1/NOP2/fmu family ribosome biogenesis protein
VLITENERKNELETVLELIENSKDGLRLGEYEDEGIKIQYSETDVNDSSL